MQKNQRFTAARITNIFLAFSAIFLVLVLAMSAIRQGGNNASDTPVDLVSKQPTQDSASTKQAAADANQSPASKPTPSSGPAATRDETHRTLDVDVPSEATVRAQLESLGKVMGVSDVVPGLRRWELVGEVETDEGIKATAQLNVFQIGRFLALGSVHDAATGDLLASSVGDAPLSLTTEGQGSQTTNEPQLAASDSASAEAPKEQPPKTKKEPDAPKDGAASAASATLPAALPQQPTASAAPAAKAQPSAKFGLDGEWIGAVSPLIGELEKLQGVVLGDANMPPQDSVYIFFDPRCPYCKQTYEVIKANWPNRRVKWIPGIILGESPEAYAIGASMLEGEKAADNLNTLMTGGRVVGPAATDEQKQVLLHNTTTLYALMQHMDPNSPVGVPAMYWSHRPTGQFAFASGASQKAVLEKVFGPSVSK